jgi:hypothetical protein
MYRKMMSMSVAVLLAFCLAPVDAKAQWALTPNSSYFGEVAVGSSSSQLFTVTNWGNTVMYISSVELGGPDAGEFSLSFPVELEEPYHPVEPGADNAFDIVVTYTPQDLGDSTADLRVDVSGSSHGSETSILTGDGVAEEPPSPVSIAEILEFFDASVAAGTLVGNGPGNSADGRLNALRNKIVAAGDLIEAGEMYEACNELMSAYERCDGLSRPPEFADGPAASELAGMIFQLMADLGC